LKSIIFESILRRNRLTIKLINILLF